MHQIFALYVLNGFGDLLGRGIVAVLPIDCYLGLLRILRAVHKDEVDVVLLGHGAEIPNPIFDLLRRHGSEFSDVPLHVEACGGPTRRQRERVTSAPGLGL